MRGLPQRIYCDTAQAVVNPLCRSSGNQLRTFLTADIAVAHVRSELSGDARAPGQTFPYRKTILFTKQQGIWRIRALHNTRLLDPEPSPR